MNENEFQTIYELCSEIQDECDRETPNLETIKIHAAAIPEYLNEILDAVRSGERMRVCHVCGKKFYDAHGQETLYAVRPHIVAEVNCERKGGIETFQEDTHFCSWRCLATYAKLRWDEERGR